MAKARGASGKAPLGGGRGRKKGHRRAEAVTEAPASSRCPLRGLSSQALGCRRSSFFLWLGHLLSSSLWKACVRAACLPGRPRPRDIALFTTRESGRSSDALPPRSSEGHRTRWPLAPQTPVFLNHGRLRFPPEGPHFPVSVGKAEYTESERW